MAAVEMIRTSIEYHITMTRRVWGSIDQLTEQQFVPDHGYSRGSIRNLMVYLSHTDLRWLTGLEILPDPARTMKSYEQYPHRASVRAYWESVAVDLTHSVDNLDEGAPSENAADIPGPRWRVLLHLVNQGTDHRSTALPKLQECGAPTFDQDSIIWLAEKS